MWPRIGGYAIPCCYNIDMESFSKKKGCSSCDQPKDQGCGISPAVLQINNPSECTLFHKVEIPASMGNEVTIPPDPGKYRNVLLYYEASGNAYLYTSDGIPTLLSYTDYLRLLNKPSINGVLLTGDKTLEELGINDATLTIKQGNTTLGTFSANASENVEINVPGSDALSFTMQYTVSDSGRVLPGWYHDDPTELVMSTSGGYGVYKRSNYYNNHSEQPEFPVTFLNESTNEVITPQGLYDLLLDGTDIILNHVPLGTLWSSEWADGTPYADGVHLTKFYSGVEGGEMTVFGGSASVITTIPNVGRYCMAQLGFTIFGDDTAWTQIDVQGLYEGIIE